MEHIRFDKSRVLREQLLRVVISQAKIAASDKNLNQILKGASLDSQPAGSFDFSGGFLSVGGSVGGMSGSRIDEGFQTGRTQLPRPSITSPGVLIHRKTSSLRNSLISQLPRSASMLWLPSRDVSVILFADLLCGFALVTCQVIEAKTPAPMLGIEGDDLRMDSRLVFLIDSESQRCKASHVLHDK